MTEQSRILVTGATGNAGREVVSQLMNADAVMRALVRNPDAADMPEGVEVVGGDLSKSDTLEAGLEGVEAVFLVWPFLTTEAAPAVVEAVVEAVEKHARRIVYLSSAHVRDGVKRQADPINQFHSEIERIIEESELEWTFLRSGGLATNALGWADQIRAKGVVREPFGAAARSPIHERDIAAVAVRALTGDGHGGKKHVLTGPETLTSAEQVRIIGEETARPLRFEEAPVGETRREWISEGWPPEVVDGIFAAHAEFVKKPEPITNTVEEITGHPARSFREWASDHAADFQSATTEEVASEYVSRFREGDLEGATRLYSKRFTRAEQAEAFEPPVELRGEEVARNTEKNIEEEEIHAFEVDDPFVGGDEGRFAVRFSFDSTFRSPVERKVESKISLYTVEDGEIVREEVYHTASAGRFDHDASERGE